MVNLEKLVAPYINHSMPPHSYLQQLSLDITSYIKTGRGNDARNSRSSWNEKTQILQTEIKTRRVSETLKEQLQDRNDPSHRSGDQFYASGKRETYKDLDSLQGVSDRAC